ncbi:MAG: DUF4011 domain-containing protein [Rhodopila sp.]|jgi:hypothetical protein
MVWRATKGASKARIWEQVEALWRAVASLDIRYVSPAPSFERIGQKIRPPSQIRSEKLATCLDLAVLFAAAIEAIGLRPVIVLVRDHAFAGFWLTRHDFGCSVADDAPGLRTRLALHDLLLFETTLVCGSGRSGFKRACEAGEAHVVAEKDTEFEAVIDVQRARQRRIRPLSSGGAEYMFKVTPIEDTGSPADLPPDEAPPLRDDPDEDADEQRETHEGRLERWRKRLLDLTGRNRLLNLPSGGKQVLPIDCPDPVRLERLLSDMQGRAKAQPLRFRPWPELMNGADPRSAQLHRERMREDSDRAFALEALDRRELVVGRDDASLQAALTEIYRSARAAQQEGGTNTLFLTIGSLLWRQGGKEKRYRAPIVLLPVTLERPSVRSRFSLRPHDDEVRINPTLLEMLRQEFDIRLPAPLAERPGTSDGSLDVAASLDAFRMKLRDIPGWEVTNEVTLTNLSFTKYLMWKDLSDRAEILRESEVARRLMDRRAAVEPETSDSSRRAEDDIFGFDGKAGDLDETAADLVCPFEADSSQLRAVAAARAGESFVMIGPPGTGKSQTIANIIADMLSQRSTVLFVAEKRAALEVVQRHLRRIGLGDFCLDLSSPKSSKALILEQMGRAQQAREDFDRSEWQSASADIGSLRSELNAYVRELHRRGRNGWTPFRAMGCAACFAAAMSPRWACTGLMPISMTPPTTSVCWNRSRTRRQCAFASATFQRPPFCPAWRRPSGRRPGRTGCSMPRGLCRRGLRRFPALKPRRGGLLPSVKLTCRARLWPPLERSPESCWNRLRARLHGRCGTVPKRPRRRPVRRPSWLSAIRTSPGRSRRSGDPPRRPCRLQRSKASGPRRATAGSCRAPWPGAGCAADLPAPWKASCPASSGQNLGGWSRCRQSNWPSARSAGKWPRR